MSFFNNNLNDNEIAEIEREKAEEQERDIQRKYTTGEIPKYDIGNGKSNKKNGNPIIIPTEKEIYKTKILNEIAKLRKENYDLSFDQWTNTLIEKRQILDSKVNEYFPEISSRNRFYFIDQRLS